LNEAEDTLNPVGKVTLIFPLFGIASDVVKFICQYVGVHDAPFAHTPETPKLTEAKAAALALCGSKPNETTERRDKTRRIVTLLSIYRLNQASNDSSG
jgi:hypothetical protein